MTGRTTPAWAFFRAGQMIRCQGRAHRADKSIGPCERALAKLGPNTVAAVRPQGPRQVGERMAWAYVTVDCPRCGGRMEVALHLDADQAEQDRERVA